MSDDLISRKALLDELDSLRIELNVTSCRKEFKKTVKEVLDTVKHLIEDQPTAFDKEKVIEKLKDQYNYSRKVRNKNDNDYFEYWDGRTDSYKDAIEIVEKGGIE